MFAKQNYRNSGSILHDLITTTKQNTKIFAFAQQAKNPAELASLLKSDGITRLGVDSVDDFVARFSSLPKLKAALGHYMSGEMNGHLNEAKNSFGTLRKMMAKVLPQTPWSKYPMELELVETLQAYATTQAKLMKNESLLQRMKNIFVKFEHGKNLSNIVEHGDKIKFNLKTVTEAKDFFDNVAYIGKSSPEILRTLFKGFPLIMVGKDVLETVFTADPSKQNLSLIGTIIKALGYITPVVGPILLVRDSVVLNNWNPTDLAGAGIGAGMLGYDLLYAFKSATA